MRKASKAPKGPDLKKSRAKKGVFSWRSFLGKSFKWGVVFSIWGIVASFAVVCYHLYQIPKVEGLLEPVQHRKIFIYDQDHALVRKIGGDISEVHSEDLPDFLKAAVISIEDRRFYEHFGIDVYGLARAMFVNVKAGHVVQGGSTITQQLAKNLFLSSRRDMSRKLQEAILAIWLELSYSKDEILTAYLNRVYFGSGVYGVDAGAEKYFGKKVYEISVGEAAILAGLLKAPSRYSPMNNEELSFARARTVLQTMAENGYLFDPDDIEGYMANPEELMVKQSRDNFGHYYTDFVTEQLEFFIDTDIAEDLHVYTKMDRHAQAYVESHLKSVIAEKGEALKAEQAAFVMSDLDGGINVIVGGNDYLKTRYNRAMKAQRQPGSVIKPLYYMAALDKGYHAGDLLKDEPLDIDGWKPRNFSRNYQGDVTLEKALCQSINTASIRLLHATGIDHAIDVAKHIGVTSEIRRDLTYALGTSEMTLAELVRAYTTIANGGYLTHPYVITEIQNDEGEVLYQRQIEPHRTQLSDEAITEMNELLLAVTDHGTGRRAAFASNVAGKSGTTQNHHDAWFVGYTGDKVAGIWFGNDDNHHMSSMMTGGRLPAEVWGEMMGHFYAGRAVPQLVALKKDRSVAPEVSSKLKDKVKKFFDRFY